MAKFPARLPRSREPSQPALSYEHIENFTKDLEVRRDLGNRASPVNRAHMKRPLECISSLDSLKSVSNVFWRKPSMGAPVFLRSASARRVLLIKKHYHDFYTISTLQLRSNADLCSARTLFMEKTFVTHRKR